MRVVKFKRQVSSPVYGDLVAGDLLRCDDSFAAHVVADLSCAEYADTVPAASAAPEIQSARVSRAKKQR